MNNLNKSSKFFLLIFVVTGTIWLGSYITRLSAFYQLFRADEFVLKDFVNDQNISGIFQTLIAAVSINMIFYLLMIISFILFIIISKLNVKYNGWLFISIVLVFLTAPFEFYLMSIDYKIVILVICNSFNPQDVLSLVIKRFTILSSFPIVEILSYLAVTYLFLFQPLKGKQKRLVE
jgi:hypothetical protein